MKSIYAFLITINFLMPLNVRAEYTDPSGFEALKNRLSSEENINNLPGIHSKISPSFELAESNKLDKKLEALNYCSSILEKMSEHYDIFDQVSTSLMLGATSSFGINNIKHQLERTLDDYNHYARRAQIACQNSNPKVSYVKQYFQLASGVLDRYIKQYGY